MDIDRIRSACSETLVVGLLREKPRHGYEMCKEIEARSQGYFTLKHSTLYPILHRLEKSGLVTAEWESLESGKPRKVYRLTRRGEAFHGDNIDAWRELFSSLSLLIPEVAR